MKSPQAKFFLWLDRFEKTAVTLLLGTMIIVVFLQVFFRFVIKGSLPWSEELSRYVMIWAVFFGASMGAKSGAHIGVEAFVNFFPQNIRRAMIVVSAIFTQIFCVVVCILSIQVVAGIYDMEQVSPAMEIPIYIPYVAIPVGAILMSIRFMQATIEKWRTEGEIKA